MRGCCSKNCSTRPGLPKVSTWPLTLSLELVWPCKDAQTTAAAQENKTENAETKSSDCDDFLVIPCSFPD
jgi:hypothetical protein